MSDISYQTITLTEKQGAMLVFHRSDGHKCFFDLRNGKAHINEIGKEGKARWALCKFFSGIRYNDVIKTFTPESIKYADMIFLSRKRYDRCSNIGTLLYRFHTHLRYLENWTLLGIKCDGSFTTNQFPKEVLKWLAKYKITVDWRIAEYLCNASPHLIKILTWNRIAEDEFALEPTERKNTMKIWSTSNAPYVLFLINEYSYDTRRLMRYLYDYLPNREGLDTNTAINMLLDYARMNSELTGRTYEKYPKHLKSVHDIVTKIHAAQKKQHDDAAFATVVNSYRHLGWEGPVLKKPELYTAFVKQEKPTEELPSELTGIIEVGMRNAPELSETGEKLRWRVIIPDTPGDVTKEGAELNHCVGSYVDRIIGKELIVAFLRCEKDKSFITLEIRVPEFNDVIIKEPGVKGYILQARGIGNRYPEPHEIAIIHQYCEHFGFKYDQKQ